MRTIESTTDMQHRAEQALCALLSQVSTVKLREIRHESHLGRTKGRFVAHVEVLGRSRALACEIKTHSLASGLRKAIEELDKEAARLSPEAIPVLIVPQLSADAEAICKASRAAFLDFEGNARISLGEVFIVKRRMRADSAPDALATLQAAKSKTPAPLVYVAPSNSASAALGRTDAAVIVGAA